MSHGWVILVRRTREREYAVVEEVVKVKRAGVALSVLSHEQEVVQTVPSCFKRLASARPMRGFLRSLICPGNVTPSGRSRTASVRIF